MRVKRFRQWVYLILVLSALFRFGFLIFGDVLPVMWDARRYAAAAIGLLSYVDPSGAAPVGDERADRHGFKRYCDKYIQGESIEWQYYNPHTLTQARGDLFYGGPLYPLVLAIVFYLAPVADFTCVRVLGILQDLLANLLVILIARRLAGQGASIVAGIIYAVYFPFVLASTMLLLETSTGFLILLALYLLIRAVETNKYGLLVGSGLITGLLALNKPTATLLLIPLTLGFYFYARPKWSRRPLQSRLIGLAAPAVVLLVGWVMLTSARYGELAVRDPVYVEAVLRQSSSIQFEGYDLDEVDPDFWTTSVVDDIVGNLPGYAGLIVKKFDRLWSRPYNDFKKQFVLPYGFNELFHFVVVSLALLGLLLLVLEHFQRGAWPLLIAGYYTATHLVFHSLSRYNVNSMPLMTICAAYFLAGLFKAFVSNEAGSRKAVLAFALLLAGGWLLDYRWTGELFGSGLSRGLVIASLALKHGLIVLSLVVLGRTLFKTRRWAKTAIFAVFGGLVFAVVSWSSVLSRDSWAEFSCRLDDPAMKAGTRIYVSKLGAVDKDEILAVLIDVNSGAGRKNSFTVTIGGSSQEFVGGQKPLTYLFYAKPSYRYCARYEQIGIEEFRQYAILPVSDSAIRSCLDRNGHIDVWVAVNDRFHEENNYVTLYGNYPAGGRRPYLPSPRYISVERHVDKGDPRIRIAENIISDSAISYYIGRDSDDVTAGEDLSPSPCYQTGRYNIFLMRFKHDGTVLVY